jgi:hypothetical protein
MVSPALPQTTPTPNRYLLLIEDIGASETLVIGFIDLNYHEDRSTIRTGFGPENVTQLRRFSVSISKAKGVTNVAQKMWQLNRNVSLVFDYLYMTKNSCAQGA